jgi:ectoine hydroxylase-related dioxygenase (phytanoyl-CoA dioxygenase family)
MTCSYDDPELLEIIQHPFFEEVAKRALRADEVRFFQTAITTSYPQPDTRFSFDQHVDIQYCLSDLNAVPRRMICSYFLWISDVNERRAPMMVRPGSHWLIAEERERDPVLRNGAPRVAGASLAQLPALAYADPIPLVARAGQVSVLTTATVHGASVNVDTAPRKAMVITFTAAGVEIALPPDQAEQKRAYDQELRLRLRPERAHMVSA